MGDRKPISRLNVVRTFSDGQRVPVGTLAQNAQGVFFQYESEYLEHHPSLSPFDPPEDAALHGAEKDPHEGLYGVFADSLPDGWGRLLMDRAFESRDDLPDAPTAMDRLAYVGDRGTGALSYEPSAAQPPQERGRLNRIAELGHAAQSLHEGSTSEVLDALFTAASSAGARPKAQLYLPDNHPRKTVRWFPESAARKLEWTAPEDIGKVVVAQEQFEAMVAARAEKLFEGGMDLEEAAAQAEKEFLKEHTVREDATLRLADDIQNCSTEPAPGMVPHLVKFTSARLPLGHEEAACEAAYLALAEHAGIEIPEWCLLVTDTPSGIRRWLLQVRFDRHPAGPGDNSYSGRLHFASACGLLDADFRAPTLDYEDLIKAAGILCRGAAASQAIFRRAAFNLFACNQDDHSKNWGFLQDDDGDWRPAPFYDVTYSPHPHGEHATAYAGHGRQPPLAAMQSLAAHAGFASWKRAREVLAEMADAVARWPADARALEIRPETCRLIGKSMQRAYRENRRLLASGP